MAKYEVARRVLIDDEYHEVGTEVELKKEQAEHLVARGTLITPGTGKQQEPSDEELQAEAAKVVEEAQAKADELLAEAKAEAEAIVSKATDEAEAIMNDAKSQAESDADELVNKAKAEAEAIVDEAKKKPQTPAQNK